MHSDRFLIFDISRAFLAFWVFYYHLEIACLGYSKTLNGAIAVDLFLVISGFLITYHWYRSELEGYKKLKVFYLKRFFRIAPLYYFLLIINYIFDEKYIELKIENSLFVLNRMPEVQNFNLYENIVNVISHFTFLFGLMPQYISTSMMPDWSLSLEMQFYFAFPFIIYVMCRHSLIAVYLVSLVIVLFAYQYVGLYEATGILGSFSQPSALIFKIHIFMGGIALAHVCLNKGNIFLWGSMALCSLAVHTSNIVPAAALMFYAGVLYADILSKFIPVFLKKSMKVLGDTSYAVYLTHVMIYIPCLNYLYSKEFFIDAPDGEKMYMASAFIIPMTYIISYILYVCIEKPSMHFGKKIIA